MIKRNVADEKNIYFVVVFGNGIQCYTHHPRFSRRNVAYPSTQRVSVDGAAVEFQMYVLKDENGNNTNYVKVRDVAYILNGTSAQFSVKWDGAVDLIPGQGYESDGGEMSTPFSGLTPPPPRQTRQFPLRVDLKHHKERKL